MIAGNPLQRNLCALLSSVAMINPYQPPEAAPANRTHNCPVCNGPVGFWRFAFPFGYCEQCSNYLTIRHWNQHRWLWSFCVFGIIAISIWLRARKLIEFTPPVGTLLLVWFMALMVHGKVYGKLVPAYCWGFFATPDDDRITIGRR